MTAFEETARAAVDKYGMFDSRRRPLIALSGGADSVALLLFLKGAQAEYGISCSAVHVHHGIRETADRDADFCAGLCRGLGVPLQIIRADVPALAREWKCGLEEAGRRVRYAAYDRVCDEFGCDCVCTAHHADDNLETVIFNLTRSAGARGLAGIPPVRENILRPLILCTREMIREYLAAAGQDFVEDETNSGDDFSRNYIRHNVIPPLRALAPDVVRAVSRSSEYLRADDEYLTSLADAALADAALDGERWRVDALAALPDPVLTRALFAAARRNINAALAADALREGADTRLSVGEGTALIIYRGTLRFTCDRRDAAPGFDLPIELEKKITAADGAWEFLLTRTPPAAAADRKDDIYEKSIYAAIDPAAAQGKLFLRSRLPGDRVAAGGARRTVKNLLQEAGVPADLRRDLVFLCDERGIIWIPGAALRDGCAADGDAVYAIFTRK